MTPSKYQIAFLDTVRSSMKNIMLKAVAGSGKSTSLKMAAEILMEGFEYGEPDVLACAFNKHIVKDLTPKMPSNTRVATMHSLGLNAWKDFIGPVKVDQYKTESIMRTCFDMNDKDSKNRFFWWKSAMGKLISLFKAHGPSVVPMTFSVDELRKTGEEMSEYYDIKMPKLRMGEDNAFWRRLQEVWQKSMTMTKVVDFDDMIAMPVYHSAPLPQFRLAMVDECQDLNPVQIDFILQLNCRLICVGDERQAIYGFRGADAQALTTLSKRMDAVELPLSVCYRCAKSIVAEAQKFAPEIEAFEGSPDGVVEKVDIKDYRKLLQDRDYVLCRCTAPLVSECLSMIREGRKATVKGRDIGKNLIDTIEKLSERNIDISTFIELLKDYYAKTLEKLERSGSEARIIALNDTVETLQVLAEECSSSEQIINRINSIFSEDDSPGVTFCTVHKAKGLEATCVSIIEPDLMPHPAATREHQRVQEMNIIYVAITRAQSTLRWVYGKSSKSKKIINESKVDAPKEVEATDEQWDEYTL